MIARSFLYALFILVAYNLLLALPATRTCFATQSLWQDNLIRYQEYVLQPPTRIVLVGTSLIKELPQTRLGDDSYNLAATGGNVLSGVAAVLKRKPYPKTLVIETSRLMQDGAGNVVDSAFRPVFMQLRAWLPAFRERYQPANLAAGLVSEKVVRPALPKFGVPTQEPTKHEGKRDFSRFPQFLAQQIQSHAYPHDPVRLRKRCEELKAAIAAVKAAGIRPILLDMPFDPALMATPPCKQLDAALREFFPETDYEWIRPNPLHTYETTDGIHLSAPELDAYAVEIRKHL